MLRTLSFLAVGISGCFALSVAAAPRTGFSAVELGELSQFVGLGGSPLYKELAQQRGPDNAKARMEQLEKLLMELIRQGSADDLKAVFGKETINKPVHLNSGRFQSPLEIAASSCGSQSVKTLLEIGADLIGSSAQRLADQAAASQGESAKNLTEQKIKLSAVSDSSVAKNVSIGGMGVPCSSTKDCVDLLDAAIKTANEDAAACRLAAMTLAQATKKAELASTRAKLEQAKRDLENLPSKIELLEKELGPEEANSSSD